MRASGTTPAADVGSLVSIRGLTRQFQVTLPGRGKVSISALAGVDLDIPSGGAYGLVGESGSGKTTLARCLLRLLDATAGRITVAGRDVTHANGAQLRELRREMQVVFQDPVGSLDPRLRVQDVVAEPIRTHLRLDRAEVATRVAELLDEVGLSRAHLARRAHELSGGQCQRVAIARALALRPRLLVLDEPTSALDVSIQAQILNLLASLRREHGLTYLLISHDLGVVRYVCDRIGVMYLGRIVEEGPAERVLGAPEHPYTRALTSSRPSVDGPASTALIRGEPPGLTSPPTGCAFHPRCSLRVELGNPAACTDRLPPLRSVAPDVTVACHFVGDRPPEHADDPSPLLATRRPKVDP